MQTVAVIDIGKTNVKVALVDLSLGAEVAVETQPNRVIPGPPWPHFDVDGQWAFLSAALRRLAKGARVEGIVVTTHGACAALLDRDGGLAAPVLDYEHTGPDAMRAEYDAIRPPFSQTGSPVLPMGLNLGAQLHWMLTQEAGLRDRVAQVVTWPQYWGYLLTGEAASDLCSLGCHTDLWNPWQAAWSPLVDRLGLAGRMAPPRRPGEVLGLLRPEMQADLGIGAVPVLVGIHDSNASLLPHLLARAAPFSVVSTGTWVISMAIGGAAVPLDPARDTLVNVSAFGEAVPSARFMGGREFDLIRDGATVRGDVPDAERVRARGVMLLPSVVGDSGPFPGRSHHWTVSPEDAGERAVALGYYLALMTAECLGMIGAAGPSLIEGPFCANDHFLRMLASATGRPVHASAARTGTALGAAMLFGNAARPAVEAEAILPDPVLVPYAEAWRRAVRGHPH
jgi:sugar (pentulose or hexulose) kinase